ncbi:glycosyltransferase family 2 protein [Corynebacterium glutamicum]|uniref:glycosyltransferase family 2 protein n=1 Tax=Corynebacterium glutamicum TaxID=1718 RepID=UPI000744920C|nr:glycosyltransferase family A protein [Corynebacterium glutamicum]ALZ99144.1 hypothetical protein APT58_02255 [Corynebacterium glutamicum]
MPAKVSIIIPLFNAELHLERCVSSVLNQSYENIEILLIDDGSIDRSLTICNEFAKKDTRVTVLSQKNAGVSAARNAGIDAAKGKFLTFVDSDDLLEPNAIYNMVHELEDSNADAIRTRCVIDRDGVKQLESTFAPKKYQSGELENIVKALVLGEMPAYMWLLMIRAESIPSDLRLETDFRLMEDTCFYVDLMESIDTFLVSNTITYTYVINSEGATHNSRKFLEYIQNVLAINKRFNTLLAGRTFLAEMNAVHIKMITTFAFVIRTRHRREISFKSLIKILEAGKFKALLKQSDFRSIPLPNALIAYALSFGTFPAMILIEIAGAANQISGWLQSLKR